MFALKLFMVATSPMQPHSSHINLTTVALSSYPFSLIHCTCAAPSGFSGIAKMNYHANIEKKNALTDICMIDQHFRVPQCFHLAKL
jgi:hypothetical protein